MKRLIMTSLALCAATALAMPEKKELAKTQPLVNELMSSVVDDYKAKKKTAKEVAETAEKFANEAEGEAAKFLLLKGAVTYYSRAAEYDKAADMVEAIKAEVKDVPPEVLSEIISKATLRISSKNAPRLYALYKAARAQVKAQKELKTLEAALKKRPGNLVARREYAEALAVSGDWQKALQEFAQLKDTAAAMAKAELDGKAKSSELAEFWWSYKTQSEEVDDALKARAAMYYKKAIDAEELSGLKKTLAEQRIAEVGTTLVAAAVDGSSGAAAKGNDSIITSGKSPFVIKGNKAMLTFPNGHVMEFIKCPAGKFNMVYDYNQDNPKYFPAQITRAFWMSKKRLTLEEYSFIFSERNRAKPPKGKEKSWYRIGSSESPFPRLMEMFGAFIPKGYVFRLPSLAEFNYAYHANTKDRKDPYYHMTWLDIDKEVREKITKNEVLNKWGLEDMNTWNTYLDRFEEGDITFRGGYVPDPKKGGGGCQMKMEKDILSEKDPFSWSESDMVILLHSPPCYNHFGWCRVNKDDADSARQEGGHIVIGPDLVSEWKAKHKKK
jgi:hypothetical protein